MYHYTDEKGFKSITSQKDWLFKASQPPGKHPFGAYFTTLPPNHKNLAAKLGVSADKVKYYFKMDIPDNMLKQLPGGRGINKISLYVPEDAVVGQGSQMSSGKNQFTCKR